MRVTPEENATYGKFVNDLAVELGVFDLRGIETVWHYTDGNGFLGILQSGRLYATQVSALNDSKETEYAADLFREEVMTAIVEQSGNADAVAFFQSILEQSKEAPNNPTQGISKFYVACFSAKGDDLNQWAKYTKSSPGRFAIAFHPYGLNREPNSTLYRVIYDRAKLKEAVKKVVYATLDFYMSGLTGERAEKPEEWAKLSISRGTNGFTNSRRWPKISSGIAKASYALFMNLRSPTLPTYGLLRRDPSWRDTFRWIFRAGLRSVYHACL